ncbi:hypothetical protein BDV11DRAFT_177582 [Aspergillus similis]
MWMDRPLARSRNLALLQGCCCCNFIDPCLLALLIDAMKFTRRFFIRYCTRTPWYSALLVILQNHLCPKEKNEISHGYGAMLDDQIR